MGKRPFRNCLAGSGLCLVLAGCGSDNDDPDVPAAPAQPASVAASLNALGVDTRPSPRLDGEGKPYPASFSPFGARFAMSQTADGEVVIGRISELALAGFRLGNGSATNITVIDDIDVPEDSNVVDPEILLAEIATWAREVMDPNAPPTTLRDAAAGDVNGDGRQDLVFVYVDGGAVRLRATYLEAAGNRTTELVLPVPAQAFPIGDLRVAAGDFDMDGGDELAVGISGVATNGFPTLARVMIIEDELDGFAVAAEFGTMTTGPGRSVSLTLEAGNLDYDGPLELAVVVNELRGSGTTSDVATRLFVYDDAANDFEKLLESPVTAVVGSDSVPAVVADLAIADLDDDQAGEILLAGLTAIIRTCSPGDPNSFVEHVLVTLDDANHSFRQTAASRSYVSPPSDCPFEDPWVQRYVFVNAPDMDGDGDLELQVNQFIFDDVPAPGRLWDNIPEARRMNPTVLLPSGGDNDGLSFDRGNAAMVVADIDSDGRADVITYRQGNDVLEVFGLDGLLDLRRTAVLPVDMDNFQGAINPVVIPLDPDGDGEILEYQNDYQLVFTESTVLAVLAAPPCGLGIGQNTDDCTTSWGRFESTGAENERELKFEAGIGVGFKVQGGALTQTDAKSKITLSAALSGIRSEAYELTRGYSFTTGPLEDSVVFFSIPMDKYTYRVISHPDPGRVGTEVVMGLPRTPIIRMAALDYYSAHIPEGAMSLDGVFTHTPGDIDSYRSIAIKDQLLDDMNSLLEETRQTSSNDFTITNGIQHFPVFDPLEALRGLETEMLGVGQGSGATEVSLEVSSENSLGRALELGAEFETQVTVVGIVFDVNLGFSSTWTTKMTTGNGTSFVGTVGSIDAANFEREQYNFGLFTYLRPDPETYREYQVVDYFVDRRVPN